MCLGKGLVNPSIHLPLIFVLIFLYSLNLMNLEKIQLPYCPVYKPRFSDANLDSGNIPRPIHRVRNVDH